MAHSLYELKYHVIWHTKNNYPYLDGKAKDFTYKHIKDTCKLHAVKLIAIGGDAVHLHLLIASKKWLSIPDLVWDIKGRSSYDAKKLFDFDLYWQKGCSVFTVSEQAIPNLISYINDQPEHHK